MLATFTVDFGDLPLDPESHWDGPDPEATGSPAVGSFESGGIAFRNKYNTDFNYWVSDFAYSNETDTTTPGFANPYSSYAGGGRGDANFGLSYGYYVSTEEEFDPGKLDHLDKLPSFTLPEGAEIQSAYLTNTTWAALSMRDGDGFGKKFGGETGDDADWFKITVYGIDENDEVVTPASGAPELFLADFRDTDNSQDYILETWTQIDLSPLAGAKKIYFGLTSSDVGASGMNTPGYFVIDDIVYDTPANTAPSLDTTPNPQLGTINEDETNPLGTLVSDLLGSAISDPDSGAMAGMAVVGTSTVGGIWQYSLDNGVTWLEMVTPSETQARLLPADAVTRIRAVPNSNFAGELTISYRAWDQIEGSPSGILDTTGRTGGTGTFSSEMETAVQDISPVNDAPVLDNTLNPVLGSISEDVKNPTGTLIKWLVNPAVTDVDAGAVKGLAVVSAWGSNGDWQFSLDGVTWQSMTGAAESSARLLPVDETTRVRFVPKANYHGDAWLGYRAWDQTEGTAGGTLSTDGRQGSAGTFSVATDAAKVTVTPVNDAPVLDNTLTPTLGTIQEDAKNPGGTLIKWLANPAITDVDAGAVKGLAVVSAWGSNGDWQFSLDGVTWQSMTGASESSARLLPVDESTRVRFVPNPNYHGDAWLGFRAWDQTEGIAGGTLNTQGRLGQAGTFSVATESAKITVTPVNDAPVVSLSGTIGYVRSKPAIVLAPSATVQDVDNAEFAGGNLRVRVASGQSGSNLLAIGAAFTVDGALQVRKAGSSTIIGTLNSDGGEGTTDLVVTFTSSATKAIAQDLIRAITFRTSGGSAGTRVLKFSISDGDGATSAEATKTVNVT